MSPGFGNDERWIDRDTRKSMYTALLIIGGLVGLGYSGWLGLRCFRLSLEGSAEARGVATECSRDTGRGHHGTTVTVQYRVPGGGGQLTTHSDTTSCDRLLGQAYRVRYRPEDPDVALTAADYEDLPERLLILALLSAVMLGIGLFAWKVRSRVAPEPGDTLRDIGPPDAG